MQINSIKNTGIFAWKDPYEWMESMKGRKWNHIIKKNQSIYKNLLYSSGANKLADRIENEFYSLNQYINSVKLYDIEYSYRGTLAIEWKFINSKKVSVVSDLDTLPGKKVWYVEDRSSGAEQYTLEHAVGDSVQWTYKNSVAPFVAVVENKCYAIEVENYLWLSRLICVDADTGKNRRVVLEMKDPRWNLALIKGNNECLFIIANNAGDERLWYIDAQEGIKELTNKYSTFIPVGFQKDNKKPSFFAKKSNSNSYKAIGPAFKDAKLPPLDENIPQYFNESENFLITLSHGKRTTWNTESGKKLHTIIGNIEIDTLLNWRKGESQSIVAQPGAYRQTYKSLYNSKENSICPYANSEYKLAISQDGTRIPYIIVSRCKPRALLCLVYGAYGLATHLNTDRWKPLLDRGWAICIALVRGSGDNGHGWAEAARRENKIKSIEDFEACILAAQEKTNISPKKTVIYGRSAGGYTVGSTLSRHANGELFGAVYTEVPYVDVLSTTSNPELPLTQLEYNEFGNARRIQDAATLVHLSPVDSLPETGAPSIFVLNRTALEDKEVFPYESVKWITKLQHLDKQHIKTYPKVLAITKGEGHFAGGSSALRQRAEDLSFLLEWVRGNLSSMPRKKSHLRIYKMVNHTRKNRKNMTRKNRKNNAVTMGGKRRRNNMAMRKSRKNRRANRK